MSSDTSENTKRLGDLIDDYCPRCKLLLNHAIASMVEGSVAKVICQTCLSEHPFRHGQGGKKKTDARATLFDQVMSKAPTPDPPPAAPPPKKRNLNPARYISRHRGKPPRPPR
ncbi:MAG: hypothetical protein ACRD2O_12025 [Terriglobia bacterium]